MITKALSINFLNKELRDKARERGLEVLPEQAQINMADVSKVKIKYVTSRRP